MDNTLVLAALVVALLVVAMALLFRHWRITRTFREMTDRARRLSSGDMDQQVPVEPSGSEGDLARAFNQMARNLGQRVSDLDGERRRLAAMLATMSEGVVMLHGGETIGMANPAAEKLLGTPLPVGMRLIQSVRDYELHQTLRKCMQTGLPQEGQVGLGRDRSYLAVVATPMPAPSGSPGEVLLVLHDVTDVRRTERTRKEFVANVSHELRAPLTSIKAAVNTLQDGAIEDPVAAGAFLRRIDSEVDRMALLVSDLLDLSRIESGQVSPQLVPVDVGQLVSESVERLTSRAQEKRLRVVTEIGDGLSHALADRNMVAQVLSNLLDNAIKFTGPGGQVTVVACVEDKRVAISVADTGIGIPREHTDRIFERFYKVEKSRAGGGTGLGLAIAKHIVRAHGGEIWVESEEGHGSTFTFTLNMEGTC